MSTSRQDPPALGTENPHPRTPSAAELEDMTPEQLARLAAELDDVVVVHNQRKWPVPGTRAEKRAERAVALWFAISALSALAFLVAFLFWPYEYRSPFEAGYTMYVLYTPIVGLTFGLAVLALGIGVIAYVKKFFPDEVSVQQRHDGASDEVARKTVIAQLAKAGQDTGIARRSLIKRSAGAAAGIFGLGLGIAALAPLVRDPWKGGDQAAMWTTGWAPVDGETVYLRYDTGDPHEIALVRPEDQAAGSMMTVFPFRESERGDEEALLHALRRADSPVMLIRLRPGTEVLHDEDTENYHYGDYYAYSKICTHLGCPTSLYETQTNRILCPCHQSQFLATEYAKPVFGPAARPLPQLPITVNEEGYFVATGDFSGPIGPAFWELGEQA
ncbi:cytochrome bc1 complex Rieske iron-sulfur subunit [Pseudonocardia nigra]|uniref:cytochrome bc1 complex Rieske iron-sulfur subunit n=1 Tax=Pseudonocardia nigra TaxID=1921578 RepID=UPI001C5D3153|nr:ubiquinol-cytochrome c reductase iron-sulfur subunit [Pseudonocardia nigra]